MLQEMCEVWFTQEVRKYNLKVTAKHGDSIFKVSLLTPSGYKIVTEDHGEVKTHRENPLHLELN